MDDYTLREMIISRSNVIDLGEADRRLQRGARAGDLHRVAPGRYISQDQWRALDDLGRHEVRVFAAADRLRSESVVSHHAAAALWGIRMLNRYPERVDIMIEPSRAGRSSGMFNRHSVSLSDKEIVLHRGMLVTSPAQTLIDIARVAPFADAVASTDNALHRKRVPHPLTTQTQLRQVLERAQGAPGYRKAAAVVDFSTDLSDSIAESHSRVLMYDMGFPRPILQQPFFGPDGFYAELDFYFPDFDHGGECDGRAKYLNPEYLRGRTPVQVVIEEKNRENKLRRLMRTLSRWEPADLTQPRKLFDILSHAGLPSSGLRRRGA